MKEGGIVEIGSRVKAVRKCCGLNQSEFGLRIGLTPSGVSKLESGDRGYSDAVFLALVREFGVDENWLRTGEGEMFRSSSQLTVGERVHKLREFLGFTQSEFAAKLGLTRNFISLVETGQRILSDRSVLSIVREFDVDEDWLRTGEGEMFRPAPQLTEQGGPVDMKDRLKAIREHACLTQYDFGSRIGVTGATISRLESGDRSLTKAQILAIAREFEVDERWLRTGKGTMLRPAARSAGPSAPFCRLISVLPSLTADEWAIFERKVKEFLVEIQKDAF